MDEIIANLHSDKQVKNGLGETIISASFKTDPIQIHNKSVTLTDRPHFEC